MPIGTECLLWCPGKNDQRRQTEPDIRPSPDNIRLESHLLEPSSYRVFDGHGWIQGDVMTGVVDSSIAQYAVIEARRTEGPSEFFVIAYSDEESLRDLIAGPSIIACGFASREQAQANIDANFWTVAAWRQTSRSRTVDGIEKYSRGLSIKRYLGAGFNLTQTGRRIRAFLQTAAGMAIVIFYSRNAVSAVIRSFVGA